MSDEKHDVTIEVKHLPPGFFWVEYDPDQVDPCLVVANMQELKALGYFGGLIFPKGSVNFQSMSDSELLNIGLTRRPGV